MEARNKLKVILAKRDIRVGDFRRDFNKFCGKPFGSATISRWINNKQQPRLNTFIKLALFFELDLFDLIFTIEELKEFEQSQQKNDLTNKS